MRYEIRIDGMLGEQTRLEAFPELDRRVQSVQTVLSGELADEAQVYGLLARIQELGLRVAELRRLA
jgi:hypothetical protein